jgi:tetraacyldisaccharide 4'-kinase
MLPLVPLYAAGAALRMAGRRIGLQPVQRLQWPVISVGNLSVGGTGKTPFTIALAKLLVREGLHVDVLSRGYGRKDTASVMRVDPAGSAEQYGDEPLLIANSAQVPVFVAAKRWLAGQQAEREYALHGKLGGVHLLDDGFQHRQLARDVDIVLVNSADLGDSLLPAGNLREGLEGLKRASVLAVQDGDEVAVRQLRHMEFGQDPWQPVWRFRREMVYPEIPETLAVQPFVAFCGIGRPEQFFSGLAKKGIQIGASRTFPDHHTYTPADVEMLRRLAESSGSGALMTTAKDLFRLGDLTIALDGEMPVYAVDIQVLLEDEAGIAAWLRRVLSPVAGPAANQPS